MASDGGDLTRLSHAQRSPGLISKLKELAYLRDAGALTPLEFQSAKARILKDSSRLLLSGGRKTQKDEEPPLPAGGGHR